MTAHPAPSPKDDTRKAAARTVQADCTRLKSARTRGELGAMIASLVLVCSPRDIQQMRQNFSAKIRDITPEYRDGLEAMITGHLLGTYQMIRLMHQQGAFSPMNEFLPADVAAYWDMTGARCSSPDGDDLHLRFVKFLLAAFCMFVRYEPAHPVGTPFPGGDTVQYSDGVYYCPVREKSGDVDAALCPFCPARQTPPIGYLKPPQNPSKHRKQEFIRHCHDFHNFNG